ncbi:hypothetical protein [uncultured Methanobrevibacter sp.]|uniref:hypothetical protein n=1 Tax=uncultured Methanobrevibacter sp. TaxID=253161 RepID=UPI0025CDB5B9|nr:hypothetical protein [uncultured Methanobrevibacter sp.]
MQKLYYQDIKVPRLPESVVYVNAPSSKTHCSVSIHPVCSCHTSYFTFLQSFFSCIPIRFP